MSQRTLSLDSVCEIIELVKKPTNELLNKLHNELPIYQDGNIDLHWRISLSLINALHTSGKSNSDEFVSLKTTLNIRTALSALRTLSINPLLLNPQRDCIQILIMKLVQLSLSMDQAFVPDRTLFGKLLFTLSVALCSINLMDNIEEDDNVEFKKLIDTLSLRDQIRLLFEFIYRKNVSIKVKQACGQKLTQIVMKPNGLKSIIHIFLIEQCNNNDYSCCMLISQVLSTPPRNSERIEYHRYLCENLGDILNDMDYLDYHLCASVCMQYILHDKNAKFIHDANNVIGGQLYLRCFQQMNNQWEVNNYLDSGERMWNVYCRSQFHDNFILKVDKHFLYFVIIILYKADTELINPRCKPMLKFVTEWISTLGEASNELLNNIFPLVYNDNYKSFFKHLIIHNDTIRFVENQIDLAVTNTWIDFVLLLISKIETYEILLRQLLIKSFTKEQFEKKNGPQLVIEFLVILAEQPNIALSTATEDDLLTILESIATFTEFISTKYPAIHQIILSCQDIVINMVKDGSNSICDRKRFDQLLNRLNVDVNSKPYNSELSSEGTTISDKIDPVMSAINLINEKSLEVKVHGLIMLQRLIESDVECPFTVVEHIKRCISDESNDSYLYLAAIKTLVVFTIRKKYSAKYSCQVLLSKWLSCGSIEDCLKIGEALVCIIRHCGKLRFAAFAYLKDLLLLNIDSVKCCFYKFKLLFLFESRYSSSSSHKLCKKNYFVRLQFICAIAIHLCDRNSFVRSQFICAIAIHLCDRNSFVRLQFIYAIAIHLCDRNSFVRLQFIYAIAIHLCDRNSFMRLQFICAIAIHLCDRNSFVRSQFICAIAIHLCDCNSFMRLQFICAIAIHLCDRNSFVRSQFICAITIHLCDCNSFVRSQIIYAITIHWCDCDLFVLLQFICAIAIHLCDRNSFVRSQFICAIAIHLCDRNSFVRSQFICAITIHLCDCNSFMRLQFICAITNHLCDYNSLVRLRFICTIAIHLCDCHSFVRSQFICAIAIHLCDRNSFVRLQFIYAIAIHLCDRNSFMRLQFICAIAIHLCDRNSFVRSQFICAIAIHLCDRNSFVRSQFICAIAIHLCDRNSFVRSQFICAIAIHLCDCNSFVRSQFIYAIAIHLCDRNSFVRLQFICAIAIHLCDRNSFVRLQFIYAITIHLCDRNSFVRSQFICAIAIHLCDHNSFVRLQFICAIAIHLCDRNSFVRLQFIYAIAIHLCDRNSFMRLQFICAIAIHLCDRNSFVRLQFIYAIAIHLCDRNSFMRLQFICAIAIHLCDRNSFVRSQFIYAITIHLCDHNSFMRSQF
ncbi:hypothetical protein GJ496_010671 [Pomphorhynchus laevis]|nr:hypothetical protein GJ496_010671 [Pomphorhynchus laevis]